jgi:hypothetical protein
MTYTLEQLIAMKDEALQRAAQKTFSMMLDPFSELGARTMKKKMEEAHCQRESRISPGVARVIGAAAVVIENILDYQEKS